MALGLERFLSAGIVNLRSTVEKGISRAGFHERIAGPHRAFLHAADSATPKFRTTSNDERHDPMGTNEKFYDAYWAGTKEWAVRDGVIEAVEADLFRELLRPAMRCLDYGCGDGRRYGRFLKERGIEYCGADISREAMRIAAEIGLDVQPLNEDGGTVLPAESCDAVLCMEVLEHLVEPNRAVAEMHRLLKPGGILIASVPNIAHWFNRVEFLLTGFLNPGGSPLTARKMPWQDPHIRFFCPSMLKKLALQNGFEQPRVVGNDFDLGGLPYFYRRPRLSGILRAMSFPVRWLGRVWPSPFASRIFLVARKPVARSGASPQNVA